MPSALAIAVGPKPLRSHFAHPDRIYRSGPAFAGIDAVRLRPGDALHLALFPKIGLELGEYPQHVEEALPRGCAGVDRLFSRLQGDATLPEVVDDVLQVAQRTGKPIDPGHDQRIPLAQELKQRRQLLPTLGAGAGDLLGSHHGAAGGCERGMLDRQVLVDRRNAGLSVDHGTKCLKTVDVDWITYRNSGVNGFET